MSSRTTAALSAVTLVTVVALVCAALVVVWLKLFEVLQSFALVAGFFAALIAGAS